MTALEKRAVAGRSVNRWTWGILVLVVLVAGLYFASRSGADPAHYSNDFNVYYYASHEVIQGRDPYERSLGESTRYLYLPLLSELMIPLALLPLPAAAYIWFLINAASLIAAAWMSASLVDRTADRGVSSPRVITVVLGLIVVVRFALDNFDYGQVNPMVAALAVAHIFLYERKRKLWSAAAFVLAVSIKLTPAILIVYHLARRRFKYAASCFALFGALTALSFAPFGSDSPSAVKTFVSRTIRNEQGFDLSYSGNQSLRGALARLRADADEAARLPSDALTIAVSLAMLALPVLATILTRNNMAVFASLFCCIALLSPLAWKAHFILFIFPAVFLVSEISSKWGRRRSYAATALLIAAFSLFNLTSPTVMGLSASEWVDSHSLVFAGGILVYAAALLYSLDRNAMTSHLGFVTLLKGAEKSE
jgi:alpha-1,2-mannosyltransferase